MLLALASPSPLKVLAKRSIASNAAHPCFPIEGKPPEYRQAILDGLYQAMREVFDVRGDHFMTIDEYDKSKFLLWPKFSSDHRNNDLVIVRILNNTRGPDKKKALFARIAELLTKNPGIRPENILVKSFGSAEGELVVWERHRTICMSGEVPLQGGARELWRVENAR